MYSSLEVVQKPVAGRSFVCIQLYAYNGEMLDAVISPQTDVDSIVMYIATIKERHNLASIRIATDIREVLKRFVTVPGYLALYSTQAELSRAYRMLDEKNEQMQLVLEIYPVDDEERDSDPVETKTKLTIWESVIECIKNLLKRVNTKSRIENR